MTRLRTVATASLCLMTVAPAAAADLSGYYRKAPQPYYVVNQGPVISGPGISVVSVGVTWTGVSERYPFVRPYPCGSVTLPEVCNAPSSVR